MDTLANPWSYCIRFLSRALMPRPVLGRAFRTCVAYADRLLPQPCSAPSFYDEPAETYFQHRIRATAQRSSRPLPVAHTSSQAARTVGAKDLFKNRQGIGATLRSLG